MTAPTRRTALVVAAGLPLSLLPVLALPRLWPIGVAYLAGVAIALAVDALLAPRGRDFDVAVDAPDTLFLGDPDPATLTLACRRAAAVRAVTVRVDVDERLDPPATLVLALDEQGRATAPLPLRPRRRGTAHVEAVWLRFAGPLGLVERTHRRVVGRAIAVVSNLRAVRQAALQLKRASATFAGRKPERFLGDGSEFDSLREYAPGFDPRTIDWKSSARHVELLCRELRAERNHQLVVALDCGQRMREPIDGLTRLDRAVNAALVLSWVGLAHGDRVGLFAFGAEPLLWQPPRAGTAAFPALRRRTADLEASTDASNYTLGLSHLAQRLARRALVVLFTDFADAIGAELLVENVARLARRHVVLFVAVKDPELERIALAAPRDAAALHRAVAAEELLHDRAEVLEKVARLGVHVLDARAEAVTSRLVNKYLDVKRRELVA